MFSILLVSSVHPQTSSKFDKLFWLVAALALLRFQYSLAIHVRSVSIEHSLTGHDITKLLARILFFDLIAQ